MRRQVILVVVLVAAVSIVSLWSAVTKEVDRSPIPSTFSAGPKGCKAVYLTLQDLGIKTSRLRRGYQWLANQRGTLIVVDPGTIRPRPREITKLKEWIKKGNQLVFFEGPGLVPKPWKNYGQEEEQGPSGRSRKGGRTALGAEFGLGLVRSETPQRQVVPVAMEGVRGVERVSFSKGVHWKTPKKAWTILVRDDSGPLVLVRKLGSGKVTAIADRTMISNQYLGDENNLRFLVALLLAPGHPRELLFDEYHHGYVIEGSLWKYVGSTVFMWVLCQCGVGCALFFYSRRARLAGRYRSLTVPSGRSSLEQVDSMANIFESCDASSVALEAILRRTFTKISRKLGVPLKRLEDGTFAKTGPKSTEEWVNFSRVSAECLRAVRVGAPHEKAVELARSLVEARSRIVKTGSIPHVR